MSTNIGIRAPSPGDVIASGIVLPVLGIVAVSLRFYGRRVQRRQRLWIDDWLLIPAAILNIGIGVSLVVGAHVRALGYPTPPSTDPDDALASTAHEIQDARLLMWLIVMLQQLSLMCTKLSLIFFYRRIFCIATNKVFSILTYISFFICASWGISFFISYLFVCKTYFAAFWISIEVFKANCNPILDMHDAFTTSDLVTDILVFLLPIREVWKLQMSSRRKLALLGVFCVGLLTIAASITRMIVSYRITGLLRLRFQAAGADNMLTTTALYWSMIESGLALIAACLPTFYGLFKLQFQRQRELTRGSGSVAHPSRFSRGDIFGMYGVHGSPRQQGVSKVWAWRAREASQNDSVSGTESKERIVSPTLMPPSLVTESSTTTEVTSGPEGKDEGRLDLSEGRILVETAFERVEDSAV